MYRAFLNAMVGVSVVCSIGCSVDVRKVRDCSKDDGLSSKRAEFIVNCAAAANPHSDEEGEDLVAQCERTAFRLHPATNCDWRYEWERGFPNHNYWEPCDEAPVGSRQQRACVRVGWQR